MLNCGAATCNACGAVGIQKAQQVVMDGLALTLATVLCGTVIDHLSGDRDFLSHWPASVQSDAHASIVAMVVPSGSIRVMSGLIFAASWWSLPNVRNMV